MKTVSLRSAVDLTDAAKWMVEYGVPSQFLKQTIEGLLLFSKLCSLQNRWHRQADWTAAIDRRVVDVADQRHQWRFAKAVNERESVVSEIINGKRCLTDKKKKSWGRALKADPKTLFPTNE